MKEQLYILFCESPFQTNKVDEDFEDQFISAKENGFETLLFNFEDLTSADRFSVATKRIKQNEEMALILSVASNRSAPLGLDTDNTI
jgi:hypothetical protein